MAVSKEEILDAISNMTVMEIVDLIGMMEEKFGVSAAAFAAAPAAAVGGGDAGPAAEERTEFDVIMSSFGDNKVNVIKVVRGGPEGSQGSGGGRAGHHQDRRAEGLGRVGGEGADRSRRDRRGQVILATLRPAGFPVGCLVPLTDGRSPTGVSRKPKKTLGARCRCSEPAGSRRGLLLSDFLAALRAGGRPRLALPGPLSSDI